MSGASQGGLLHLSGDAGLAQAFHEVGAHLFHVRAAGVVQQPDADRLRRGAERRSLSRTSPASTPSRRSSPSLTIVMRVCAIAAPSNGARPRLQHAGEPLHSGCHAAGQDDGERTAGTVSPIALTWAKAGDPLLPAGRLPSAVAPASEPVEHLMAFDPPAVTLCRLMCRHRTIAAGGAILTRPDLPAPLAPDAVQHTWPSYSLSLVHLIVSCIAVTWLAGSAVPVQSSPPTTTPRWTWHLLEEIATSSPAQAEHGGARRESAGPSS